MTGSNPYNADRLDHLYRKVHEFMEEHLDPGILVALLFFHWLQTLYVDEIIQLPIDDEDARDLERELTEQVRHQIESRTPEVHLQKRIEDLQRRIRSMFPRRILHQRDIYRLSGRLVDELENMMVEALYDDGNLMQWRNEIFIMWWSLRSCLDHLRNTPKALSPDIFVEPMDDLIKTVKRFVEKKSRNMKKT